MTSNDYPCRVQAGHCFHLFTKFQLGRLAEYQQPEMLRTPLEELLLQIKVLKLGQVESFLQKAIEAPERKAVNNAIRCLKDLVSILTCVNCVLCTYMHVHVRMIV